MIMQEKRTSHWKQTSVLSPTHCSQNSEFCFLSCQQSSQMVMHFKMNLLSNCLYQQIGPLQCSLQPWEGWPTAPCSLLRYGFVCATGPPRETGLYSLVYITQDIPSVHSSLLSSKPAVNFYQSSFKAVSLSSI